MRRNTAQMREICVAAQKLIPRNLVSRIRARIALAK
jgi:hypothetical protein